MDDESALRHIVAPGEYPVQWSLPDQGGTTVYVHGSIELIASHPPRGTMVFEGVPTEWTYSEGAMSAGFPQKYDYPILHGKLHSNHSVAILDATVETWDPRQAIVYGRCALVGLPDIAVGDSFQSVRIQTTYLDRLVGVTPIAESWIPTRDVDQPIEWRARQAKDLYQRWTSDHASLSLGFDCRARTFDPYEFMVRYSPLVTAHFAEGLSLDEILHKWILPLRGIATVSMGVTSDLTFVCLAPAGQNGESDQRRPTYLQLYGVGISQDPFAAKRWSGQEKSPALTFKTEGTSLLRLIEAWQAHTGERHPLYETYVSVLGIPDDHPRSRLLLYIQALEGHFYHEKADEIENRRREYTTARTDSLAALEGCMGVADNIKRFLKNSIPKEPRESLARALKWAADSLPGYPAQRLQDSRLVQEAMRDHPEIRRWPDALRQVRNDLAHGNRSYDPADLHKVASELDRIVRAHVLRSVGAADDVLTRVIAPDDV